jgi:hypothetical protein
LRKQTPGWSQPELASSRFSIAEPLGDYQVAVTKTGEANLDFLLVADFLRRR